MPTAVAWSGGAMLDNKYYVIGGVDVSGVTNVVQVYDPASGAWEYEGEMTMGRIGHRAIAYQDKIYVFGGEVKKPSPGTLDDVEVYDPATSQVFLASELQYVRGASVVFAYQGKIYVCGGHVTLKPDFTCSSKLEIGIPDF